MMHIIFDFDGVLINSFNFHLQKMNELYARDITAEEYSNRHMGNFYDNQSEKFQGIDYHEYARKVSEDESSLPPVEGSIEVLRDLAKRYTLHVITSGWKVQVQPFFEKNNIAHLFSSFWFAEQGKQKKEKFIKLFEQFNITARDCVFVTDTLGDILEAHDLGISVIAVDFGYHSRQELAQGKPDHIVSSWKELEDILISNRL